MINIKAISKYYKRPFRSAIEVIDGVSFEVQKAEIVGLLGLNGAGKTTTLRMVSTALKPNKGDILVDGYSVLKNPEEVRKNIGFLSTHTQLQGRLTVKEELIYCARLFRMEFDELEQRLELLGKHFLLDDLFTRKLNTLSAGQLQRANLVRVLIHDPKAIILDEPTTGLDIASAGMFVEMMKQARDQGKSILFSTHNMSEVKALCDRVVVIHKGRVVRDCSVNELMEVGKDQTLESVFLHAVDSQDTQYA